MEENAKRYFNELGVHYHQGSETNIELLKRMDEAASLWVRGDVLDIGSGGIIHFRLDRVSSLTLVDVAINLLDTPRIVRGDALVPVAFDRITTKESDALFLPFEDESFDTVTLFYVCHHLSVMSVQLSRERTIVALREARRVLKRNGVLLVCEANATLLARPLQNLAFGALYRLFARLGKPLPYFFSRSRLIRLLHAAEFSVISITPLRWGRWVYNPLLPGLPIPGWLWSLALGTNLLVAKRK
jgi:ubiquinone/menaquinone biosynthesis C-methylase UbiE